MEVINSQVVGGLTNELLNGNLRSQFPSKKNGWRARLGAILFRFQRCRRFAELAERDEIRNDDDGSGRLEKKLDQFNGFGNLIANLLVEKRLRVNIPIVNMVCIKGGDIYRVVTS